MHCFLSFVFVLLVSVSSGSTECPSYEFPCEDGGCVDLVSWCDSHKDCSDGSDEKYCKKNTYFNKDPNKCPSGYFKCNDGPCIPIRGRCDDYKSCSDSSDEKNCGKTASTSKSNDVSSPSKPVTLPLETRTTSATTKTTRTTTRARVETQSTHFSDSGIGLHSVDVIYSEFQHFDYSHQREKARNWLLSQRSDFGWGDETPRALTALYLSDMQGPGKRNESDWLMVKQLEIQLSLDISRNRTNPMKLTDLALYINALQASCKNPRNFFGENLVNTLRNGVNAAHKENKFVSPSVYLTLCLNNATTYDDTRKLHEVLYSRNSSIGRTDIQSLALLTIACIYRNTNHLVTSAYDGLVRQFMQRNNISGSPGNVYEASLLVQVLQELRVPHPRLLQFILKEQREDGSFDGILATYLALPVLAGRSFLQMNKHCSQRYSTDIDPIEVLKNTKRRKIHVQYSLNFGYPIEVTEIIQMQISEGINFLDVMRLAQEINPKFRFMLDDNREVPVVYSIGGIPNDAEKGKFWILHLVSSSGVRTDGGRLAPYSGNIKQLIPRANDEFIFWIRSM